MLDPVDCSFCTLGWDNSQPGPKLPLHSSRQVVFLELVYFGDFYKEAISLQYTCSEFFVTHCILQQKNKTKSETLLGKQTAWAF